jgi:hypothetical protein
MGPAGDKENEAINTCARKRARSNISLHVPLVEVPDRLAQVGLKNPIYDW